MENLKVSIIGGGPVGALCACFLGNRGLSVTVYELREDMRLKEHVQGRSINLALSERGRSALRCVGLEQEVINKHGIPMYARMIHSPDGTKKAIPYGKNGQCIYSVGRRFLNETLLTEAEKNPKVKMEFSHKLICSDFENGSITLENSDGQILTKSTDLIIGCDGAFSAVRKQMSKTPRFDYSQQYIPHGYLELCIPLTTDGKFAMEPNYLHIWPRKTFMLIALPNQDKTYTVTLFMPFEMFSEIDTTDKVLSFFEKYFIDAVPLIGREKLSEDFFKTRASPLVSIKCHPYHMENKALILGDAAHAMVPFFGQGLNAGFEDCEILAELMDAYEEKLDLILPAFTDRRNKDAHVICDLAMYNYIEMRDHTLSRAFLIRKKIDFILNFLFPKSWIPLYSMVTFNKIPYADCLSGKQRQDKVLSSLQWFLGLAGIVTAMAITYQVHDTA